MGAGLIENVKTLYSTRNWGWHWNQSWAYNHGKIPGMYRDPGPPGFSGIHHLFGDGHVIWKSVRKFKMEDLRPNNMSVAVVPGSAGDATYY